MPNSVNFTTIPNGLKWIEDGNGLKAKLRVSLVTSPRLDFDPNHIKPLRDTIYKDFQHWPNLLKNADFKFRVRAQPAAGEEWADALTRPLQPITDGDLGADDRFWVQLFPLDTIVGSPIEDEDGPQKQLASYDARMLHEAIALGYLFETTAIRNGILNTDQGISSNPILRALAAKPDAGAVDNEVLTTFQLGGERLRDAFNGLYNFHNDPARNIMELPALDNTPSLNEFHEILSALQEHNRLCRKLGLVHDFEIDLSNEELQKIGTIAHIKFDVGFPAEDPNLQRVSPWTLCDVEPKIGGTSLGVFHPRNSNGNRNRDWGGFRTMAPETGLLTNFEVDWLGRGIAESSEHLAESELPLDDFDANRRVPRRLPALRQGVVNLIDLPASRELQPDVLPVVQDILEARANADKLRNQEQQAIADPQLIDANVLHQDQGLVRGYRALIKFFDTPKLTSLCSRELSYKFGGEGELRNSVWSSGAEEGEIQKTTFIQEGSDKLQISPYLWAWDGWSLVAPRIASPVDDDGNVVELETPPFRNIAVEEREVPGTILRKRIGKSYQFVTLTVDLAGNGWSLDEANEIFNDGSLNILPANFTNKRLEPVRAPKIVDVEERTLGERGALLAIRHSNGQTETRQAHIVPPDSSLGLVEEHGIFDQLSDDKSFALVQETLGSFPNSDLVPQEFLEQDGRLRIPYLPDPLAEGVILRLLKSGTSSELVRYPPQRADIETHRVLLRSIRLNLLGIDSDQEVGVIASDNDIFVSVPAGETIHAEIFSGILSSDLDSFWAANPSARLQELLPSNIDLNALAMPVDALAETSFSVTNGAEYVICPSSKVTFVHATQRPVASPSFGSEFVVKRTINSTACELEDPDFTLHVPSTGRLEFVCQWTELIDDENSSKFVEVTNKIAPFGYALEYTDLPRLGDPAEPKSYWAKGTREPTSELAVARNQQTSGRQAPTGHNFPDTKYRRVTYTARAITRYGSYFPPEVTNKAESISKITEREVEVLNCAKPDAPKIRSILPVFRKDVQPDGKTKKHITGCRILVERPWLSSGEGEKLAVILHPGELTQSESSLSNKFTSWGFNPRKLGPATSVRPTLDQIKNYTDKVLDFKLRLIPEDDSDADLSTLALYDVEIDSTRNVVFCDIELDPERAYYPFVRFALARYQQKSIAGAHLSNITTANYVQLAPSRTVSISDATKPDEVRITVSGFGYKETEFPAESTVVEVIVERLIGGQGDTESEIWQTAHIKPIELTPNWIGAGLIEWSGNVSRMGTPWRLTVLEYEIVPSDKESKSRPEDRVQFEDGTTGIRRLVFSERVEF